MPDTRATVDGAGPAPPSQSPPRMTTTSTIVTAVCIAANSLTAGSMFCFPLIGPSLMADFSLSLKETNTIWSGAVLGEYISAAFWGVLADTYGPRPLSLSAAILFGVGYGLMAQGDATIVTLTKQGGAPQQHWLPIGFMPMSIYFTLVGAGVAASYFSAVTASTRLFPSHPGLSIAMPLTLFSLSSLFLTWIGSQFFVDSDTGDLKASSFLAFLAILLCVTNLISTLCMRVPDVKQVASPRKQRSAARRSNVHSQHAMDESTPLLDDEHHLSAQDEAEAAAAVTETDPPTSESNITLVPRSDSLKDFLATPSVWILAFVMFTAVGGAEMVMSSVGSMVVSLLGRGVERPPAALFSAAAASTQPGLSGEALRWRSTQVQLLATANTLSRLASGFASDFFAPSRPRSTRSSTEPTRPGAGSRIAHHLERLWHWIDDIRLSRMTILLTSSGVLALTFAYAAFGLDNVHQLMVVSVLIGTGYGFVFTQVPSIVASAYGLRTFGRSWGLLSYSCAAGSLGFSLLYAIVSDATGATQLDTGPGFAPAAVSQAPDHVAVPAGVCLHGRSCFQLSFIVAAVGTAAATMLALPLWQRWHAYL